MIRILELISVAETIQRCIHLNKIQHFVLMEGDCKSLSSGWCNSLNWIYLNDADVFLQFRGMIRILVLITVPNHSRDSFILIKFNILSSWREIVIVLSSECCNSRNWI